jgi:hypothetical protein
MPTLRRLVDDNPPIHNHCDSARAPTLLRWSGTVESQGEQGDVNAGRLAGTSGKVKDTRPSALTNDLPKEPILPIERFPAIVNRLMKRLEIVYGQAHDVVPSLLAMESATGKRSPSPK